MKTEKKFLALFSLQFLIIISSVFLLGSTTMRIIDPGDDIGKYSLTLGAASGAIIGQSVLVVIVLLSLVTFAMTFSIYKREMGFSAKTAVKRKRR